MNEEDWSIDEFFVRKLLDRIDAEGFHIPGYDYSTRWLHKSGLASSLIDQAELVLAIIEEVDGSSINGLRRLASTKVFKESAELNPGANWSLFWSITQAAADLLRTFTRPALYEEPHNAAFFAHLSSTFWTYAVLQELRGEHSKPGQLFWADYTKDDIETNLGADFMIAIAVGPDELKLALFQAKPSNEGRAIVSQKNRRTGIKQIDILTEWENKQKGKVPYSSGDYREPSDSNAFGCWCFYTFWNMPQFGIILPPTVKSVDQVALESCRGRASVDPIKNALSLSDAIGLHLADRESPFGIVCSRADFGNIFETVSSKPKRFLGLSLSGSGWHLGYWWEILEPYGYQSVTAQEGAADVEQTTALARLAEARSAEATTLGY